MFFYYVYMRVCGCSITKEQIIINLYYDENKLNR